MAPPNTTALTATPIPSSPATITIQVDDLGTTYEVWYSFVPPTSGVRSIWGYGGGTSYSPSTTLYQGPASAPTEVAGAHADVPFQWWLVAGTTYLIQVEPNAGNPAPANLTL